MAEARDHRFVSAAALLAALSAGSASPPGRAGRRGSPPRRAEHRAGPSHRGVSCESLPSHGGKRAGRGHWDRGGRRIPHASQPEGVGLTLVMARALNVGHTSSSGFRQEGILQMTK